MNFTNWFFKINNFHRNSIRKWKINNKKNPRNHIIRRVFWPSNSKFFMSQYEKKNSNIIIICSNTYITSDFCCISDWYYPYMNYLHTFKYSTCYSVKSKKMNEKLLLTIPNKKIFGDNSSQTHIAEKLGKNVHAKKSRKMKWINFTEFFFECIVYTFHNLNFYLKKTFWYKIH